MSDEPAKETQTESSGGAGDRSHPTPEPDQSADDGGIAALQEDATEALREGSTNLGSKLSEEPE